MLPMNDEMRRICGIYHKRNVLGRKRDSLRQKYRYLQAQKRSMQIRDNYQASDLYASVAHSLRVDGKTVIYVDNRSFKSTDFEKLAKAREDYLTRYPISKKFKDISLSKMNLILLEAEAEVCKIKIEVMKHTHKYDKALNSTKQLYTPKYVCGIVKSLEFRGDSVEFEQSLVVEASDFHKHHQDLMAVKAIDKMLKA